MAGLPYEMVIDSEEYAAFHETGHICVAHMIGARVDEAELYRDSVRSWGRTRCERTEEQAPTIALGGFAAEYLLHSAGRIRRPDGTTPTEREFVQIAAKNAYVDRLSFMGLPADSDVDIPKEIDARFIGGAVQFADQFLDPDKIVAVAEALFTSGKLTEEEINSILMENGLSCHE